MKSSMLGREVAQLGTIKELTGVFESIASMRIGRIREKVRTSQNFFDELWAIYTSLRIDPKTRMAPPVRRGGKPNLFVVLTSEGGLSGDIDGRIIDRVRQEYQEETTDLLVVGAHGATLLAREDIKPRLQFKLPDVDQAVDVSPIVAEVMKYPNPSVFYQRYVSLSVQEVDRINLVKRVQALGAEGENPEAVISPRDYLFEPGIEEVVSYLESVMLEIALGQVILESRLAQLASRFNAMSAAHKKAGELNADADMRYHRSKRREGDERLKEIINAMSHL